MNNPWRKFSDELPASDTLIDFRFENVLKKGALSGSYYLSVIGFYDGTSKLVFNENLAFMINKKADWRYSYEN